MKITELIIDAYGCDSNALNDEKFLLTALRKSAKAVNAKIRRENVYKYNQQGVSIVLFLAETHITIFTWPEFRYATIGIFLCNEKMDPLKAWHVIKEKIKPQKAKLRRIPHFVENKI